MGTIVETFCRGGVFPEFPAKLAACNLLIEALELFARLLSSLEVFCDDMALERIGTAKFGTFRTPRSDSQLFDRFAAIQVVAVEIQIRGGAREMQYGQTSLPSRGEPCVVV